MLCHPVSKVVRVALNVHSGEMAGDILVFLTGKDGIRGSMYGVHRTTRGAIFHLNMKCYLTGQSEIEKACDMLYEKAESIDYRYDVQDQTVEGLLILPLYGSMPTGMNTICSCTFLLH